MLPMQSVLTISDHTSGTVSFSTGHAETTFQPMIKHTIILHGRDCAKEDTLRVDL